MVSKKYWEKPIKDFINISKKRSFSEHIQVLGHEFDVLPGVFSPIESSDTEWFARNIALLTKNKVFLEIGSGSGVITCLVALQGAAKVLATDINPTCVENTELNAEKYRLDVDVFEGNLFKPIPAGMLFDFIFWNHPFYFSNDNSFGNCALAQSVIDYNYNHLRSFFEGGAKFLNKGGSLLLGTSNVARINFIKKFAKNYGYHYELITKTVVPVYKGETKKMDLRLMRFTPVV